MQKGSETVLPTLTDLLGKLESGDRVFVRGDLNVPLQNGSIQDTNRLEAVMPTLHALIQAGAIITLATHLGRPRGIDPDLSTRPIADFLTDQLSVPVIHVEEFPPGDQYRDALLKQPPGSILLLENLRYDPREKTDDPEFARLLMEGNQYYVNDAFGCCHRAHASVSAITRFKPSFCGSLIEKELAALEEIRDRAERPFWIISGGAKVSDKLGVLGKLAPLLDGVVCTGGLANTLLHGNGIDVGSSRIETDSLGEVQQLLGGDVEVVLPIDFVAGDAAFEPTETVSCNAGDDVPDHLSFFDIGPRSVELVCEKLKTAKTVFWNGPAGVFETPEYSAGTREIARYLALQEFRVVIGGGDSAAAVRQMGLAANFHHVSTGGGAALEFLEGKLLPGLEALSLNPTGDTEQCG